MSAQNIQEKIDSLHYWDARVVSLECNYFADEVTIEYEDSFVNVVYKFNGCYKTEFEHDIGHEKDVPVKELTRLQIPYFLHNVDVGSVIFDGIELYICKISMSPMNIEIWCKDIQVQKCAQ
ncbi:hypothetical protein [Psychrobacillus sp. FJAT-21963]|uniref:hypothetical protein n=1 Tax=Psychrobacillus sp. FJAT-21963 TaxID=1712028 RepID=UPI0006FEAB34|nr:hypothetical protein [Psychrobacillus sp. FJAT-21963]KQL34427.1 hypothetical protein AN959_15645 [Psychrobacillus sp. FJAT-21963]